MRTHHFRRSRTRCGELAPCLGLPDSVVATLAYLLTIAHTWRWESLGVSQPTISRAITVITPLLSAALGASCDRRRPRPGSPVHRGRDIASLLVMGRMQGTLLREAQDNRNERPGRLHDLRQARLDSDPVDGSRHDRHCLGESDVLRTLDPKNWIGDKGYIGNDMITPFRKPEGRELLDWQKEFNTEVNKIRWMMSRLSRTSRTGPLCTPIIAARSARSRQLS